MRAFFVLISIASALVSSAQGIYRGGRIVVKPTFYLSSDATLPSQESQRKLLRHLAIAQQRFHELLDYADTFELDFTPKVFRSNQSGDQIKSNSTRYAEEAVSTLMRSDAVSRWTCPFVYVIVFVGTDRFPLEAGGRPINGGHNNGGGIVVFSLDLLDNSPNIQSTLQHELGHAFGLVHVDAYGYSMDSNSSMMSYNQSHKTSGYRPSATPASFIPEDLRALGMNKHAFPKFNFIPARHAPQGYELKGDVILPPMELENQ